MTPSARSLSSTGSHTPVRCHSLSRSDTHLYRPNRSGRSFHAVPVFMWYTMLSSEVRIYLSSPLLENGVEIIDMTGLNSAYKKHTEITRRIMDRSDATIFPVRL